VEQAKAQPAARARAFSAAQQQIELDTTRAREALRREVAGIAVRAASSSWRARSTPHARRSLDKLTARSDAHHG